MSKNHAGFCVKELFPDIDGSEIAFLNKAMKYAMNYANLPMLPKRLLPNELYESNQWPHKMALIACSVLCNFRDGKRYEEIYDTYIEIPIRKWDCTPFFDGTWEKTAANYGLMVLPE